MSQYPDFSPLDYDLRHVYNTSTGFFEHFAFSGEYSGDNGFAHYTSREQALQEASLLPKTCLGDLLCLFQYWHGSFFFFFSRT